MSAYVWSTKESRRTRAFKRKDEREAQAKDADVFAEILGKGVEPPPFVPVFSETERRVEVREGCGGILIGKKGENIRNVEQRFKVSIRIEDAGSSERRPGASVARGPRSGPQQVVVSGLSPETVEAAARELDIVSEVLDLPPETVGWAVGRNGKHLKFIKELSGVSVLSICRSGGQQDPEPDNGEVAAVIREVLGNSDDEDRGGRRKRRGRRDRGANVEHPDPDKDPEPEEVVVDDEDSDPHAADADNQLLAAEASWLEIKGQRDRVQDALMLFEAHLGYYPVYVEMDEAEAVLDQEITDAQALLGRVVSRKRHGVDARSPDIAAPHGSAVRGAGRGRGRTGGPLSDRRFLTDSRGV